ncbi:helix-turn-helix domain-containing protein [Saccharopolyspora pogona]|uniref:helix-turn-helix domain-containing protein n=1 Tax=Saccharopolyspora pogona TaxID=333966 RepID=UPI0016895AFA|nr:helix-turn-helix transcriptional regulator [Saccharopolyspora pogona]
MRWNLRLAAANRGIWQASDLQRLLAERGMVVSLGKMSHLWSGQPASIKLADLEVICAVLGCEVGELLIPEPETVPQPDTDTAEKEHVAANERPTPRVVPRRRDGRSLPPA